MTTTVDTLPEGTTATDYWFDSAYANGVFPDNRDKATFSFGTNPVENCVGFQFLGCSVTSSYYVFDHTNNQIQFTVGSKVYITSITTGTYTASNLVTQMALDMTSNTLAVSGSGANNGTLVTDLTATNNLAVLVDDTTSQLLIYPSTGAGTAFSVQFPASYTIATGGTNPGVTFTFYSAQEILGFQSATTSSSFAASLAVTYNNSSVLNSGTAITRLYSPYAVNLSGPDYLILHSSLKGCADKSPLVLPHLNTSDLLAIVPVNVNYQGTIYTGADEKVCLVNAASPINSVDFYFTLGGRTVFSVYDIDGNITTRNYLSFNGSSFLVGVRFFQNGKTVQSQQSNIQNGDKVVQGRPTKDGASHKMHEMFVPRIVSKKRRL